MVGLEVTEEATWWGHGGTSGDGGSTYLQTTQTHLSPAAAVFALSCLELPAWSRVWIRAFF